MIVLLTCHTEGCINFNTPIPIENPESFCVCGPCGQEILDKQEQQ